MKLTRLTFSPALPCVECTHETTQGLVSPANGLTWQLVPLCAEHEVPPGSAESVSLNQLRCRINEQLAAVLQFQRQRRQMGRAYVQLRRQHAPLAMRHALRRQLKHECKWSVREVQP